MSNLDTSVLDRKNTFSQQTNDELAGYTYSENDNGFSTSEEQDEDTERLVDEKDLLTSDRASVKNSKWLHLFSALLVASIFALIGYCFFWTFGKIMTAGKQQKTEQVKLNEEEQQYQERIEKLEQELDRKDAKLAFNQEDTSEWEEVKPEPEPKPKPELEPEPEPSSFKQTSSSAAAKEEPNINALDEWARLATIGTANGENYIASAEAEEAEDVERTEFSEVATSPSTSNSIPPSIEDTMPTQAPQNVPNLQIEKGEVAKIASVAIGNEEIEEPEPLISNSSGFDLQDPMVAEFLSNTSVTNDYLEQKKRQYREEDRLKELSSLGNANAASKSQATLVSDVSNSSTNVPTQKRIPLGNSIEGKLTNDLILSEGLEGVRGIIHIDQPLLADDGTTALRENSAIIVEAKSVNNSGLIQLEAIALSYENSLGKLVQEALPQGSILIQGKNSALIANRVNGSGGSNLGQDLLLAGLGAGEKAFEIINEPERASESYRDYDYSRIYNDDPYNQYEDENREPYEFDRYNYSSYDSGDYGYRKSDEASLATGAAEGAFGTTKDRLEDRSHQIQQDRRSETPIYQLKAGTQVTIFINSFLTIES